MTAESDRWFSALYAKLPVPSREKAAMYLRHLYDLLVSVGDITGNERTAVRYVLSDNADYEGADPLAPALRGLAERMKYAGELSPFEYACIFYFVGRLERGG